jgi:mannose-1-phosphate guanylyltransferase/mannose-6-phosphate isomerase
MLIPVILSGGAGTRLWPVSREAHPKPFMKLPDGESLLQKTMLRNAALDGVERILTITNRELFFKTRDEYEECVEAAHLSFDYVLEPVGRNTAPAIAMAALHVLADQGEDATLLVVAADHLIENQDAYARAVKLARNAAADGYLATFGIHPLHPETGYGYIQRGTPLAMDGVGEGIGVATVESFVEKPDLERAQAYLADGGYFWNSGMFCFRPSVFLDNLEKHAPDVYRGAHACWEASRRDVQPLELDKDSFAAMPSISVDYAVMEKAERVAVVDCDLGWSDIGSWSAYSQVIEPDGEGNRVNGEAIVIGSRNCFVESEERLVAAVGLSDTIIVDTADALLVIDKAHAQDVKKVVEQLKSTGHEAYRLHRTVSRPWGTYTVLEEGNRYKIKRITVKPGAKLSLQLHHHRSEHWIVVSGTAKVVNGENHEEFLVRTNESTYIPAGIPHRLMNPGVVDLHIIEVQSGDYLEEDDIVRLDDQYGRL